MKKNNIVSGFETNGWCFAGNKELRKEEEYKFVKKSDDALSRIEAVFYFPSNELLIEQHPVYSGNAHILFDGVLSNLDDLKILNRMLF